MKVEGVVGAMLEEALASPPSERVERYRDRLAAFGDDVVQPLLTLERQKPAMGSFVVTVLEAAARGGADQARIGLDVLASRAKDVVTRKVAREARSRTGGRLEPKTEPRDPRVTPFAGVTTGDSRSPEETIQLINAARRRRGEPTLDAAEAAHVLANLERRAADPQRYRNVCWKCSAAVDAATNERCEFCSWLVCWCGGCRAPHYLDRVTGEAGHCRREVWLAVREGDASEPIDVDYRGVPIFTAGPPSADSDEVRSLLTRNGVRDVLHWTPLRNLESILQRGLLSRASLAKRRIAIVPHGYGSVEKETALRDFVCVSFEPKPWMMDTWSETPVVLELDPGALLVGGTLFVPGNSASRIYAVDELLAMCGAPYVERIFSAGSITPQAEAWIPMAVPRVAIRRVHTRDDSTAASVRAGGALAGLPHQPQVWVTPEFFSSQALESPA